MSHCRVSLRSSSLHVVHLYGLYFEGYSTQGLLCIIPSQSLSNTQTMASILYVCESGCAYYDS